MPSSTQNTFNSIIATNTRTTTDNDSTGDKPRMSVKDLLSTTGIKDDIVLPHLTSKNQDLRDLPQFDVNALPDIAYGPQPGKFWCRRQGKQQGYIGISEKLVTTILKKEAHLQNSIDTDNGEVCSQTELAVEYIVRNKYVDYAAPLAGYPVGLYQVEGKNILVTGEAEYIKPHEISEEHPKLAEYFSRCFGADPIQLTTLHAWIKIGYERILKRQNKPMQSVIIIGKKDSGKTFLATAILSAIYGGTPAKPYKYASGQNSFNGELFENVVQLMDDENLFNNIKARNALTSYIKQTSAVTAQYCNPKGKPACTLSPYWLTIMTANDDETSLSGLPMLNESLSDKIHIFRCESGFKFGVTDEERLAIIPRMLAEIPMYLRWLLNTFVIPEDMVSGRFGVKSYVQSEAGETIRNSTPETELLDLLKLYVKKTNAKIIDMTATEIESELVQAASLCGFDYQLRKLLHFSTAMGVYLSKLHDRHPKKISKEVGRARRATYSFDNLSLG